MAKVEEFSEGWRCYIQSPKGFWLELRGAVFPSSHEATEWLTDLGYKMEL